MMIPQTVYADVAPKPSLTIYVKNYKNQSYYLDVLTKGDRLKYSDYGYHADDPKDIREMSIYKYNKDGWLATHLREHLLFVELKGKYDKKTGYMVHSYGYHEVPKIFKVIVQYEDGQVVVSNEITTKQFWADVTLDLKTGKVSEIPHVSYTFMHFIFLIVLTVLIEVFIAIPFKIKPYGIIVDANIITQIFLHIILLVTFYLLNCTFWYILLYFLEILIVFIEFLIYKRNLEGYSTRTLLTYSFVANMITFLVGLII